LVVELILTVPDRQELNLRGMRMVWRDNRATAIAGMRARGVKAYPFIPPKEFGYGDSGPVASTVPLIPLGGISGVPTLLCNESGTDVVYVADELGFNNPAGTWDIRPMQVALIGDSFVHGECVSGEEQLTALIRRRAPGTVSVGVAGAGPLSELAALREYLAEVKPLRVVWFFYEGNDLEDLAAEARSPMTRYESPGFSQNLVSRRRAIDSLLSRYADSLVGAGPRHFTTRDKVQRVILLRGLRGALGLDAAGRPVTPVHDYDRFGSVLAAAKRDVESWGGKLYFAYLPERRRYDRRMAPSLGEEHDPRVVHREVMSRVARVGVPVIDLAAVFSEHADPPSLWIWRRSHYSPEGYRIVAEKILEAVER
ncbi:MAG: hypothetical protein M3Q09_01925, partial [Gemmatimonadota bacterium]|nr:hypothetical protein [Gemmatimonadota bacterium]